MSTSLTVPTEAISDFMSILSAGARSLTETQLRRYGQCILAASALYYVSTSFQALVPADTQYAVDAHLPQGYDRSVIAARLEQRHCKQLLMDCLRLQSLRDALRQETSRERKLLGWQQVFERTLVGIVAGAYTHSLTLSLFAVKNTVRVLVFVLRRREDAARERKTGGKAKNRGALGKVKAWWSGGTQSVIMESLMERMNDQKEKLASPFANAGLDEEPVPVAPDADGFDDRDEASYSDNGNTRRRNGGHRNANMVDGKEAFVYSQMISRELSAAALDSESEDDAGAVERGLNGDSDEVDNEDDGEQKTDVNDDLMRNSSCVSSNSAARTAAGMAEVERLFSVKDLLTAAVPRIVATAAEVVHRVLARQQAAAPARFSVAGSVTASELRTLLVALCEEMERSACVAQWIHQQERGDAGSRSDSGPGQRRTAASSSATSPTPSAAEKAKIRREREDGEEEDIVHYPAGSTAVLGPDGRPIPRAHVRGDGIAAAASTAAGGGGESCGRMAHCRSGFPSADVEDDVFMEEVFAMAGGGVSPNLHVRRAHREAMRRERLAKQQATDFFQEIIHSASFGELCLQYAGSTLVDLCYAAMDITGLKSYDSATDSAKMLMVIPSLEGHRQRMLDTAAYELQPSLKLFCEEIVRSTCASA